jgi:hypothetical protein
MLDKGKKGKPVKLAPAYGSGRGKGFHPGHYNGFDTEGFDSFGLDVSEVHEGYDEAEANENIYYTGDADPADSFLGLGNKAKQAARKQRKAAKQLSKGHYKNAARKSAKAAKLEAKITDSANKVATTAQGLSDMKAAQANAQNLTSQSLTTQGSTQDSSPVAYDPQTNPPTPVSGGGGGGSAPDFGSTYADTSYNEGDDPVSVGYDPDSDESQVDESDDTSDGTSDDESGDDLLSGWFNSSNATGDDTPTGKLAEVKTLDNVTVSSHAINYKKTIIALAAVMVALYFFTKK